MIGKDSNKDTLTSMEINSIEKIEIKGLEEKGRVDVLDIPGQGFFRTKIIDTLQNSKVVILFVDSQEKESILSASDYLYEVLNNEYIDETIPIIVACNKQDTKFPKTKKIIETEMSNEVENIKQIKQKNNLEDSSQMGSLFSMKSKFNFNMFKNVSFVETDKSSGFSALLNSLIIKYN